GLADLLDPVVKLFSSPRLSGATVDDLDDRIKSWIDGTVAEPAPSNRVQAEFERLLAFHRRGESNVDFTTATPAAIRKQFDFHRIMSALGDHPHLLRRLGLVLDLTLDASSIPPAPQGSPRYLRVQATLPTKSPAGTVSERLPWTAYIHKEG